MFLGRYDIEELQQLHLHDLPGAREETAKKRPQAVDRREHNVKNHSRCQFNAPGASSMPLVSAMERVLVAKSFY